VGRGQRIAFFEFAVEDHDDDAIAELVVDRLAIIEFTPNYGVIVNYNTTSNARAF
jgi:hypothetical protein